MTDPGERDALREAAQAIVDECADDTPPSIGALERLEAALSQAEPAPAGEHVVLDVDLRCDNCGHITPSTDVPCPECQERSLTPTEPTADAALRELTDLDIMKLMQAGDRDRDTPWQDPMADHEPWTEFRKALAALPAQEADSVPAWRLRAEIIADIYRTEGKVDADDPRIPAQGEEHE